MTDRVTLRGAGILITRPARQAAGLAREVAALGGTPVIFPAVIILPPDDRSKLLEVQRELSNYDYAVFVSANAVEYGVGDAGDWPAKLIAFAPGPGTAAALAAFGVTAVRTPQRWTVIRPGSRSQAPAEFDAGDVGDVQRLNVIVHFHFDLASCATEICAIYHTSVLQCDGIGKPHGGD